MIVDYSITFRVIFCLRASMFSRTPTKQDEWRFKCSSLRAIKNTKRNCRSLTYNFFFTLLSIFSVCLLMREYQDNNWCLWLCQKITYLKLMSFEGRWKKNSHHTALEENYYFNAFSHTSERTIFCCSIYFIFIFPHYNTLMLI